VRNWTESRPERLQAEVEAFEDAEGLDFAVDDAELKATGRLVLRGTLTRASGAPVKLEVRYPDSFPYLRPEVFAVDLRLERHQNPFRRNLCLLDRSSRQWSPSLKGAWLVSERVPMLLDLLDGDPAAMRDQESAQGEPESSYFVPFDGSSVFIPEPMLSLPENERAGVMNLALGGHEDAAQVLRGCLKRVAVRTRRGKPQDLAVATGALASRFSKTVFEGRWVRLDRFPDGNGKGADLYEAARAVSGYEKPPAQNVPGGTVRILGVVCKEEVCQGEWEDSWLFAVDIDVTNDGNHVQELYVVRGERLSPQDLGARIPTIAGLAGKTVALAGLGALGGPIALELGRAQVGELRILDSDVVEAGTIVRWPFGLHSVGHRKTNLLHNFLVNDYPFTKVVSFDHHLGIVPAPGDPPAPRSEAELLTDFLDGADLLIDATAEIGVEQLLAALADEAGIPQVYVTATEGGWGGVVARVLPGVTGCWYCLQMRLDEQSITPPPAAPTGTVQPRGCAAPTWTGTSFDALPIVAQAVRTACFTLLSGRAPDDPRDVFVCAQQARTPTELDSPFWTSYALEPHDACPVCAAAKAP